MQNVLVCGGAGYIGSHMIKTLRDAGLRPICFDDLSTGHEVAIPEDITFHRGDLLQPDALQQVFSQNTIDCVMHFAARSLVGESMARPELYYRSNVTGTQNLLDAMRAHDVSRIVFSSTAAVYGEPQATPIDEDHPKLPVNPYGKTKWMIEQMLDDYHAAYGINSIRLRYFNACGADLSGTLCERHEPETHLIPNILKAASGKNDAFRLTVNGNDYPTPDGTCVRDYIHVSDLCDAHLRALQRLERENVAEAYNLGTGTGYSILQIIEAAGRVIGEPVEYSVGPRRAGDPAELVADPRRARDTLQWEARHSGLEEIIGSAWNAMQQAGIC